MTTKDLTIKELNEKLVNITEDKISNIKLQKYEEASKLRAIEVDILNKIEELNKKAKEVEMEALRIFGNLNNVKREACKKK